MPTLEPDAPQVIQTVTEPAILGPFTRWTRTLLQVVVALAAAIPVATAVFDVPATTAAKLTAAMGALVALVSAVHNAVNANAAKSTINDQLD